MRSLRITVSMGGRWRCYFTSLTLFYLFVLFNVGFSERGNASQLNVHIGPINHPYGQMLIYLCDKTACHEDIRTIQKDRLFQRLAQQRTVPIRSSNEFTYEFKDLPEGNYTVFAIHDLPSPTGAAPDGEPNLVPILDFPLEPFAVSAMNELDFPKAFREAATHVSVDEVKEVYLVLHQPDEILP